jgi:predicted dehydrogenase
MGLKKMRRRDFLKTAAAATAGLTIVKPESVRGAPANSALRVGLIGCGGRGRFVSQFFPQHTPAKLVAIADPFKDRVDDLRRRLQNSKDENIKKGTALDDAHCFVGLDAYKALIESGVDAVLVESPPYFHPLHAAAAVEAGKHVYCAKPVAVDVPGCQSIVASAEKAAAKKLNFLVDFQTRATDFYIEAAKRVHEGAIGYPVSGQVYYIASRLNRQTNPQDSPDATRLRNWVFDKILSGDIIVEQNIHVLDVANWFLQSHPVKAIGTGGRKARVDVGDCWDHFIVTYWYPKDVLMDFSSAQYTRGYDDLCCRIYGNKGTVDSHYGGQVEIKGDNPWKGGLTTAIYQEGAVANVKAFVESIETGKPINSGARGAESTLTSVLGRMAAYRGAMITWDEMMKESEKLETTLKI